MTFKAHTPDGKSETLLTIPNYNFDWQMAYRWEPGKKMLPKGTRLEAVAHYDNSAFNPFNPDPKATVKDGQQTYQEMMNGFVFYVEADEKLGLDIDAKIRSVVDRTDSSSRATATWPMLLAGVWFVGLLAATIGGRLPFWVPADLRGC